ncbi:MAG: FAD-binding oxidoreductase [Bryobacterales bacterium]|nr:FAD-binding oxidoreductase [Bryobacteraceae bacterium]MDW8353592.1 FAD-binding oxidoreductase [Bryobacterales bacterium]
MGIAYPVPEMQIVQPQTVEQLREALVEAQRSGRRITLGGAFSKRRMGGPVAPSEVIISTASLDRVLQYEPRDLTLSVEAGMPYAELSRLLDQHGQMLPLDPPFAEAATIGGVLAANTSGPRRRLYGTARDLVIGMKFVTLQGRLVESGGMVVKNVAGLDLAKLLIGSFGTLAVIAVANFKVLPKPPGTRTFLRNFASHREALEARDRLLASPLQPAAVDLLNPAAARLVGYDGWLLAVEAVGNAAALARYGREFPSDFTLESGEEAQFWRNVQNFTPCFLERNPQAAVVRVCCTLSGIAEVANSTEAPLVIRAGNGVCYAHFSSADEAAAWIRPDWKAVIEFAPEERKGELELWPSPGEDLAVMRRIKQNFDPDGLLNPGRLYGRI